MSQPCFRKIEVASLPPLFLALVEAGFPSPADDWIEERLDLNRFLVKKPSATFFLRVKGDSMIQAGIHEGDILVVDRSIAATHNQIIIAVIDGDITVKRLSKEFGIVQLVPENPRYKAIPITPEMDFKVWGVVTACIHMV
jgi:DNA polymerase V